MNKISTKIPLIFLVVFLFSACNVHKKVPNGKYLLTKNKLVINGKKNTNELITSIIVQKPNSSILGYRLRLNMYNLAKDNPDSLYKAKYINDPQKYEKIAKWLSKKQVDRLGKSFWYSGWHSFLKRTGEPPVILDTLKTKKTVKRLKDFYFNKGYFNAAVNYDVILKKNKNREINYAIKEGNPTFIDSLYYSIDSPILDSLFQKSKALSFIRKGQQYNLEDFNKEKARITSYFRDHGVYHFQQQSISFEIDTLGSKQKAVVEFKINDKISLKNNETIPKKHKIFKISEVNIYLTDKNKDIKKELADSIAYNNFNLYSTSKLKYKPRAITNAIFIQKDSIYSDANRTLTLRLLSNLKVFKYPTIQYEEDSITNTLKANIYLMSEDKLHFDANVDFTRSNIQLFGISGGTGLSIRNLLKGAETLQIGLRGNLGSSRDPVLTESQFFNISEIGADMHLTIPRIFFPLKTEKIIPKKMVPSTIISGGFAKQTNIGLDKENFTAALNYNWTSKKNTSSKVDLLNIQYVKNINTANYFKVYRSSYSLLNSIANNTNANPSFFDNENNLIIENGTSGFINDVLNGKTSISSGSSNYKTIRSIKERQDRLTENNLILSSNYNFFKETKTDFFDKEFYSFRVKLESSGNLLSLISEIAKEPKKEDGTRNVLGLQYSQYIKGELDYIKNWDLSNGLTFAVRSFFGIAIPYGNSESIPFARSYFAGGSNDNRAWQSYSLGPGNSDKLNDFNEANMKLSFNAEIRFKIFGPFNGALFTDAGNIWNVLDNETDETKIFKGFSSLKDIALGTGFGFRYDFKFFLLRLDFGFKTYNPAKEDKERWFRELNLSKAVFNIGINYPF